MKSIKNHLSLVIALLSILFSMQVFFVVDRSLEAYKDKLVTNYSVIIVSQKRVSKNDLFAINEMISNIKELSPENIIKRLNTGMDKRNIEFLKLTLPKFYKLRLNHYPSPNELTRLKRNLLSYPSIKKVESFSQTHDITYKLLQLFKYVVAVFAGSIFVVTSLLIFKELRIWQFKHTERMSIMGLFGAPIWLRSAVLFRLSIVDALIASAFTFGIFQYITQNPWILKQFSDIGISIVIFDPVADSIILLSVSLSLSIILASLIVLGHKEEV